MMKMKQSVALLRPHPRAAIVILGALASLRGCDCGDKTNTLTSPDDAARWCLELDARPTPEDTPCSAEERMLRGECLPLRCDSTDADGNALGCCPGMFCAPGGACQIAESRITRCTSDAQCNTEAGQRCLSRPLVAAENTCGFPAPDADGVCPEGTTLFGGRCVRGAPCGGGCGAGEVCNIDLNRCEDVLDANAEGCAAACQPSEILIYRNPDSMLFEGCCAPVCECVRQPSIAAGRWGRFSDLAASADTVFVAAYDDLYGDVAVATYARDTLQLATLTYVDGIPADAPVAGDPDGLRRGVTEPGPNVGAYASVALRGAEPRVAYYDVDNGDLKFAWLNAQTGQWTTMTVDDGGASGTAIGDVGRYTSLAIDAGGAPHVVYYGHRVDNGRVVTGPIYARASSPTPQSGADWQRVWVEQVDSCAGACTPSQVCVLDPLSNQPACATPGTGCPTTCACGQECVDLGSSEECRISMPARLSDPCGGDCPPNTECVSDDAGGTLCLHDDAAACAPACAAGDLCVDTGAGAYACRLAVPYSDIEGIPEGVGLFASLALHNNRPTVAYYDSVRRHLRGAVANFTATDPFIATGFNARALVCEIGNDVGRHASLAISDAGAAVAYQSDGAQTLSLYQSLGGLMSGGGIQLVDNGVRPGAGVHRVGAYAALAFDNAGVAHVAYADETTNDLLLTWRSGDTWQPPTVVLADGAYGSFARLVIQGRTAFLSTYRRDIADNGVDGSRLVVERVELDALE